MCRNLTYLFCVPLILVVATHASPVQGTVFSDNFDTAHDYLAAGVAGTGWDGRLGAGADGKASAINASVGRAGQLYLESAGASLAEPWDAMPPFLYKQVEGDFIATVKVTDYAGTEAAPVYHNNCGLLARAIPEDAGPGEDWISVDYFPIWGCGNMVRMANDGARTEPCNNHLAWNAGKYLQLERKGDTFYARQSADGETWTQLCNPFVRKDLAGIPVQVGLFQCDYSPDVSYAAFDDFRVETFAQLKAALKSPEDMSRVVGAVTLEWTAGDNVLAHEVFFGADPENLDSMGMQTETTYLVEDELERGKTYYWRVDEIRAKGEITTGDVWSFVAGAPIVATMFPVTESFDAAHDFLTEGVPGTFWDGLIGSDANQTADAITTADANHPGQLYLKSTNAVWAEPWNPLGPFLFKVVKGDFIATVQVTDYAGTSDAWVYHNNCGLMARNVTDADAGAGEDWISVDYFPIWSCGNMVRTADNGAREEPRNNGKGWNAYKFLQLERKDNTFFARISADGQTWEDMGDPFVREDFNDLPVQVGLAQATFSDSTGYAAFDNFVLQTNGFQDDFSVAHDFVADGVTGTAYDGLAGDIKDVNGVANASVTSDGLLYLESVNAVWSEPWSPLGPFLYKVVSGNFVATVKVAEYAGDPNNWVYHNSCGLMVRNVADADAGPGEDWVSLDYFPIWGCGNFVRAADDGARTENCNNGLAWNSLPYLQIERVGNTFHFRVSADGQTWQEMACSPLERKDFDGLSVQIGLHHATFSDSVGYAAFDDFSIVTSQP
jgi:regulation of enolase protein 1 (concanavalin A-like superfamily)